MKLPRLRSEPGPLISYISDLQRANQHKTVSEIVRAVRAAMGSSEGAILLDLMEKATLERSFPVGAEARALDASNAQSFIPLDLRRILSDEFDAALEAHKTDTGSERRRGPGRKPARE